MKQCKYCKSAIDDNTKICPICRKKQSGKVKFIIIAIVAIVAIAAIGSSMEDDKPTPVPNNTEKETDTPTSTPEVKDTTDDTEVDKEDNKEDDKEDNKDADSFTVGTSAEYKDVIVTLTEVTESKGSEFNTPEDGKVYVLANFTFENNSDKDLSISSMLSFDTYVDGFSTTISLGAIIEKGSNEQLDGTIAPGKKMKGIVGYEVPSDYKELEINVKLDLLSSKDIKFVYTK